MIEIAATIACVPVWLVPPSSGGNQSGPDQETGSGHIEAQRSLRILVVEDEILTADYLEHLLVDLGHEVCGHAVSAAAAVRLAETCRPDLVLMDVNLGRGGDGIEAAKQILERLAVRSLFVTAYGDRVTLGRVQAVAPAGILLKPFDKLRLAEALAAALKQPD